MKQIDFAAMFEVLPSPYMVLDTDLKFVWANRAYEAATGKTKDELIGRGLFEAFPSEGEPRDLLEGSLRKVLGTGEPDSLALIRYAIPRPAEQGGGFEERYWSASHTPVKGPDGKVIRIVQNTVDVTELQRLRDAAAERQLFQRAREVQAANAALDREASALRGLFNQAPGFMALLSGPEHVFAQANPAYQQLIGWREVVGKPIRTALPEVIEQGFVNLLDGVYTSGEAFVGHEVKVQLQREPGAPLEDRYVDFVYQPIRDDDGRVTGIFVEGSDVTERALAAKTRELLIHELNHRVKNTLALVQGLAAQTFKGERVTAEANRDFMGRLSALAAAHDVLTKSNWEGARLGQVVAGATAPFAGERFRIDGPDLRLPPKTAISLAMALHELGTNAAKYGALSTDDGVVCIGWTTEPGEIDGARLRLRWEERDGPPVTAPTRAGFGSRLIQRGLAAELGGEARIDFRPEGVVCVIDAPVEEAAR